MKVSTITVLILRMIDRAIQSVFDQDFPKRMEIIIVDDGSTDEPLVA